MSEAKINYELILVNDGSPDRSWERIIAVCNEYCQVVGIELRRNFGQDNAIIAGFRHVRGELVAVMDDDLQHDPRDLPALLERAREGYDVVYADFRYRKHSVWKRLGSWFNGKVAEFVLAKPAGLYLSPFKVIRREVVDLICMHEGPTPYVDGLILQITSRISQIPVEHHSRHAGSSNYTIFRSVGVWSRLATSFSTRPLRLVTWCGFVLGFLGVVLALIVIFDRVFHPDRFAAAVAGWASLMVAHLLIGGFQMVFLGILGEYVGRIQGSVLKKPQATVRQVISMTTNSARTDA